jgi:hypothetical protein
VKLLKQTGGGGSAAGGGGRDGANGAAGASGSHGDAGSSVAAGALLSYGRRQRYVKGNAACYMLCRLMIAYHCIYRVVIASCLTIMPQIEMGLFPNAHACHEVRLQVRRVRPAAHTMLWCITRQLGWTEEPRLFVADTLRRPWPWQSSLAGPPPPTPTSLLTVHATRGVYMHFGSPASSRLNQNQCFRSSPSVGC